MSAAGALHRPVLERRRQPDRGGAEALDVVELRHQTVDVATVVEALVLGIETGRQSVAREATQVVGRVAVLEAIGHDEVEPLACEVVAQRCPGHLAIGLGHTFRRIGRADGDAVRRVVVGERQPHRVFEHQWHVGRRVTAVPGAVEGDLPLPRPGRHVDGDRPRTVGGELHRGGRAWRRPVVGAPELGLQ